jgi:hypothetical protein
MSDTGEADPRSLPPDWWQKAGAVEILIKWFRWHLVGLFIRGTIDSESSVHYYSGFLLIYKDQLLWVTAGHVVRDVSILLNSPNFKLEELIWMDSYDDHKIPVGQAFEKKPKTHSWLDSDVDFGVVVFGMLDRASLLANDKIRPLPVSIETDGSPASIAGHYVIGFPEELTEHTQYQTHDKKLHHSLTANLACLPIQRVDPPNDPHRHTFWNHIDTFYGRILPFIDLADYKVRDITGMSGSPVISFKWDNNNELRYWLVGVQSTWLKSIETIRAVETEKFLQLLDGWL